jgi:hypothetical protein
LHEDKGRTELHYVSPRLELSTGLSYNPYFTKRDFAKKDLWQEYTNLKHGLSSYKDSREVVPRPPKWRENAKKKDIRQAFDDALLPLVTGGIITSREELIYQLVEWGFELNRSGKEYISVTDENGKNHRLKGHIYAESFTSWGAVKEKIERERATVANGVPREFEAIRAELDRIVEQQAHTNTARYRKKTGDRERREQHNSRVDGAEHRQDRGVRKREDTAVGQRKSQPLQRDDRSRERGVDGGAEKMEKTPLHPSPYRPYIWLDSGRIGYSAILSRRGKLDYQRKQDSDRKRRHTLGAGGKDTERDDHKKRGGVEHDRIRAEAIRRVGEVRERTRARSREIEETDKRIRKKHRERIQRINDRISDAITKAYAGREQRERELDIVLADAYTAEQADYRSIEKATEDRQLEITVRSSISTIVDKISIGVSIIKQKLDERVEGVIGAIVNHIKKRISIVRKWAELDHDQCPHDRKWGLHHISLNLLQKMENVKRTHDAYHFAMLDTHGVCGIVDADGNGQAEKHGSTGIFHSDFDNLDDANHIVITQSPIDLISHIEFAELLREQDYFYASIPDHDLPHRTVEYLESIFKKNRDAKILIALNNESGSDAIAKQIISAILSVDGNMSRVDIINPTTNNWNEELGGKRRMQSQSKRSVRIRR